jgi:hypothetical protein
MNIQKVVAELKNETKRLDRAIAALEQLTLQSHPQAQRSGNHRPQLVKRLADVSPLKEESGYLNR